MERAALVAASFASCLCRTVFSEALFSEGLAREPVRRSESDEGPSPTVSARWSRPDGEGAPISSSLAKALLIENRLDEAHSVGAVLRAQGFSVHAVSGFEKACEALRESRYQLLVTDLEIAAEHRHPLLAALDENGQQLDMVVLSPAAGDASPEQAFRGGAFRLLPGRLDEGRLADLARASVRRIARDRSAGSDAPPGLGIEVGMSIADAERILLLATLESLGGDKRRAAEQLGISLKTLYNRLNQYAAELRPA